MEINMSNDFLKSNLIRLVDFLDLSDPSNVKIKFNMNAGNPDKKAWDLLLNDDPEWELMNSWKTKQTSNNMGKAEYLLAFAQYYPYGPEYFIFGGLYKVTKKSPEVYNDYGYNLELQDEYQEYVKRLIIKLKNPIGRDVYLRNYSTIDDQLEPEIYEIAPRVKLGNFPGYNSVSLMHEDLVAIYKNNEPRWKEALSSVKAVYVITDVYNGKLYVGSASGNSEGLWQRWAGYAGVGDKTGGNKELKKLVENEGAEYIPRNFKYSILEIFDTKTKQEDIIQREGYWKQVLATRDHGYNDN